jgi:hypothetical protein
MRGPFKKLAALSLLAACVTCAQPSPGAPETSAGKPLFTFRATVWMNLHHFLYVLGRAQNATRDSQRHAVSKAPADARLIDSASVKEREAWNRALAYYQTNVSAMDAVFDHDLISVTNALAAAGDAPTLAGVDIPPALRAVLEEAAPVYRKLWWERHADSDRVRIQEIEMLLARYGRPISDIITRAYRMQWPGEGLTVQMCAYANWAGAYSTAGRLIVVSSTDDGVTGSQGLETIFHEAMHQWDDAMIPRLREIGERLHVDYPHDLFHSLIFYTAGYATARVVPGHKPYADALWARGLPGHAELDRYWLPYLRGEGDQQTALNSLVAAFASTVK